MRVRGHPLRRRVAAAAAATVVLLTVAAACEAAATDQPTAVARAFLDTYVTDEGRVQRADQGGDTVSEGQAYALLLATAVGDEPLVDRVWGWTRAHLLRDDGLLSWRWADGEVVGDDSAADADVDAAHALVLAGARFERPDLHDAGVALAEAVVAHELLDTPGGPLLAAGTWAVDDGVVNPSYASLDAFAVLQQATGDPVWEALARRSTDALRQLLAGPAVLPPDWARVQDGEIRPTSAPDGTAPRHGFDAVRVPLRTASACWPFGDEVAGWLWGPLDADPAATVVGRALDGTPQGDPHAAGLVGAAAAAAAAGDDQAADERLEAAVRWDEDHPSYYGAALTALGWVELTTDLLDPDPDAAPCQPAPT